MYYLKVLSVYCASFLMRIFWVFPIKKNRILFMSFGGKQYSDSPKYIYEALKQKKGLDLIWGFKDDEKVGVKYVKKGGLKYYYVFCTSKIIIINDSVQLFLPVRKKQILINTWHGGGWFKKVGYTSQSVSRYDRFYFPMFVKKHTYFIASSEYFVDTVLKSSFGYKGKILRTGMPRNALFFQENQHIAAATRKELGVKEGNMLVLYAPTFRSYDVDDKTEKIDFNLLSESIKKRFNKEVTILYRAHHLIKEKNVDLSKVIDVTKYQDMQRLLLISDVLVSDYSSCMWEGAIQNKLVVVFAPDSNQYSGNRGFFLEIEKWPFLIAYSNKEMAERIINYDEKKYHTYLNKMLKDAKSYENSHSVDVIVELIEGAINE